MDAYTSFPRQVKSYKSKSTQWRHDCVDWGASHTYFNNSPVRKTVMRMKINYDLVDGIIHMDDIAAVLNPGSISTMFVPEKIQHYPIVNSKLNTLRGEESARAFEWHAIVTNPYAITRIEEEKKNRLMEEVRSVVEDTSIDDQQAGEQVKEAENDIRYNWQDALELQCNELLKNYQKEQGFKQTFNKGFMDAMICGMEVYQCGIVGGEPFMTRLNPLKLRIFRNGYSNRIEDADVIVYEDYWSAGKIIDTYYDELTPKQIRALTDDIPDNGTSHATGPEGSVNEAYAYIPAEDILGEDGVVVDETSGMGFFYDELAELGGGIGSNLLPYDVVGNIRVIHVWWKSNRKIQQVKSYDPITGEEMLDFYDETYIPDEKAGEKAEVFWINQAWEGTKIGEDIYVGCRPCLVQHNSIDNPSRCHFGIVGTIYNINESKPYSLVDMMRPYNYLYDAVHAKLIDMIGTNWGKLLELDLALKPKNWEVDKWLYFARANKVLVKDSFNEGNKGAATGKLAGGLNNASKGYIDADWGQSIQNYINLLQWIKDSMSELVGINRQREGNTYNRETVGGIERAVLQSSYITDWLFQVHDDTRKRALECFIEEAQGAMKGRSKKFQYILSDGSMRIMYIDGDNFSMASFGIVVDSSPDTQKLYSVIEQHAEAALNRNATTLSAIMKLYSSDSLGEKIRIIEASERQMQQAQEMTQQQTAQLEQQRMELDRELKMLDMQNKDEMNKRDNETRLRQAEINAQAEYLRLGIYEDENNEELRRDEMQIEKDKIAEDARQFNEELKFKREELKQKASEARLKAKK